jgi:iron complex transport system permease protein
VGVILGTLLQSAASFLRMVMDPNEFLILQGRMFASFNNVNTALLLPAAVVVIPILLAGKGNLALLDVLALGREQAINLGVDYERNVRRLLTTVVVFVSAATGLVGPITFLGLLTANLARELIRSYQHRYLLTASILIGIITLVGGQFVVERLFNFAAPLSVFINLGGGVYFVYLLLRGSQS